MPIKSSFSKAGKLSNRERMRNYWLLASVMPSCGLNRCNGSPIVALGLIWIERPAKSLLQIALFHNLTQPRRTTHWKFQCQLPRVTKERLVQCRCSFETIVFNLSMQGSKLNPDAPEFTPRDLARSGIQPGLDNPVASPSRQETSIARRRSILLPRNITPSGEILSNHPGCKSSPAKSQKDPFKESMVEPTAVVQPKSPSKLPLAMARIAWSPNKPWDASDGKSLRWLVLLLPLLFDRGIRLLRLIQWIADDCHELEMGHQSETRAIQALPESPSVTKFRVPRPSPRRFESRSASARDSLDSSETAAREEQECSKDVENHVRSIL